MAPDDLLVLFSDGLADRTGPSGELFGAERLRDAAVRAPTETRSGSPCTRSSGEVQSWARGRPAEDDQTLIVAQVR